MKKTPKPAPTTVELEAIAARLEKAANKAQVRAQKTGATAETITAAGKAIARHIDARERFNAQAEAERKAKVAPVLAQVAAELAAQVDPPPAPIPAEPPRQIVTRFYGRCKACGATIPPGCRALYQHATKRITCVDCEHPARPAIKPETAKAREMAEALPF